jgi:hypothetical protein
MRSFTGIFNAKIDRGEIYFDSPNDHDAYLNHHDGQDITVTYEITSRSSVKKKLYNYYHGHVLDMYVKKFTEDGFAGIDKVAADEFIKSRIARFKVYNEKTGETIEYHEDKRGMNKERLTKFVSDAIYLGEEMGIQFVDAEEYKTGWKKAK